MSNWMKMPTDPSGVDRKAIESAGALFAPLRAAAASLLTLAGGAAMLAAMDREAAIPGAHAARGLLIGTAGVLGMVAGLATVAHSLSPTPERSATVRVLSGTALAAGATLFVQNRLTRRDSDPTAAATALTLGAAAVLGLLVERQQVLATEHEIRLRRRARAVERWVPRRRARLDRVVIHV